MKKMILIASAIISTLFASLPVSAGTNTANAVVVNKTGKDIVSVSLVHKYSNEFRESKTWTKLIRNGESTPWMTVKYNTGFGTSGTDWWFVSFVHPTESPVLNYSDPNNFRGVIDFFERGAIVAVPALIKGAAKGAAAICEGKTGGACAPLGVAATAAAAYGAEELSKRLFNSEGTAGFKQYILRSSDANRLVTITLLPRGKIEISSPSGKETTVYSSKKFDVTPEIKAAIAAALPTTAKVENIGLTSEQYRAYEVYLECHKAGLINTSASAAFDVFFLTNSGKSYRGTKLHQPAGTCAKGDFALYRSQQIGLNTNEKLTKVVITTKSGDGFWANAARVVQWDKVNANAPLTSPYLGRWDVGHGAGLCLSTDASDANSQGWFGPQGGDPSLHIWGAGCVRQITLNVDGPIQAN